MLAASASASTIQWNTNQSGTAFTAYAGYTLIDSGLGLQIASGSGNIQIVFEPNSSTGTTTPSNIDLGYFQVYCNACATTSMPSFTFDLEVEDTTDNDATGTFVGTYSGVASIGPSSSGVDVVWATPLQIGPGGDFGDTYFTIETETDLVDPSSGDPAGRTTVEGTVHSSSGTVPEPATMALAGGLLIGLGGLARKRRK